MRALFIIHCQDPIYGASRSIGNLIRELDADIDLIFPLKVKKEGRITPEQLEKYYGKHVKNVWYLPQPARLTVLEDTIPPIQKVKSIVKDILYVAARPLYKRIYKKGNYEFIHLNSVTLYPILNRRYPMFLHVRETVKPRKDFWNRRFRYHMEQAHGIFYINLAAKEACPMFSAPQLTLTNPFDQRAVAAVDAEQVRKQFGLSDSLTMYAIIGNVTKCKGVIFVIQAFQKAMLKNAVLLVVGQDTHHGPYEQQARKIACNSKNIRFLGELENIEMIYRVVDYVVRGDEVVGLGRTVFEALYSGGGLILPSKAEEDQKIPDITKEMEDRVRFYQLQNEESLVQAFRDTQNRRFEIREYHTNVPEYVKCFLTFIRDNL